MPPLTKVIYSIPELQNWRRQTKGVIGFVPTMGALHQGHSVLLKKIRSCCEQSVLSIFVNPTQFEPSEDFKKYPRTFEQDLEIAQENGVDLVFAPTVSEMFPKGISTIVEETARTAPLCGIFRPNHFRGVTTIVFKLFNLIQPHLALFGLKDAQQFFVLQKMVQDLNLNIHIKAISTVREPDGLACSSRNQYLSPQDREKAPLFFRVLKQSAESLLQNETLETTLKNAKIKLENNGFHVQYLECLKLPDFVMPTLTKQGALHGVYPSLLAGAVFLDKTRLIDNIILNIECLQSLL